MYNSSLNNLSVWDIMPDYNTALSIQGMSSYTASYPCWLLGCSGIAGGASQIIYVNGVDIAQEVGDVASMQIPLDVGDVVTTSAGTFGVLSICAMKGIK